MPEVPGATVTREQEIGLQLPDGTRIFPPEVWHDHPLVTPEDREEILKVLRVAAASAGFTTPEFLGHYHWVSRDKITAVVYDGGDEFPIQVTGLVTGFAADYPGAHPDIGDSINYESIADEVRNSS